MKFIGFIIGISGLILCFTGVGIIFGIIMMFLGGRIIEMADGEY